jgi:hypothetical protein
VSETIRFTVHRDPDGEVEAIAADDFPEQVLFDPTIIGVENKDLVHVTLTVEYTAANGRAIYEYRTSDRKAMSFSIPMRRTSHEWYTP